MIGNAEHDAEFLRVWSWWDARPGDRDRAVAMEAACRTVAEALGIPANDFREELMAHRREGRDRTAALRMVRSRVR